MFITIDSDCSSCLFQTVMSRDESGDTNSFVRGLVFLVIIIIIITHIHQVAIVIIMTHNQSSGAVFWCSNNSKL